MKRAIFSTLVFALVIPVASPQTSAPQPTLTGFPFTNETLIYTVNWPSGLSLGEGHMTATREIAGWRFELSLDASVPGFDVKDSYRAGSGLDFCSASFSKDSMHGKRKTSETIAIDRASRIATRHLTTGAVSKVTVPDCIRDALTFVYYARRELGQGHVPAAQQMIFGALYNISLEYAGAETVLVSEKRVLTDKIVCHIKGPASDVTFDAYFDRDPARTPVAIRVPLPIGKFSLELVR